VTVHDQMCPCMSWSSGGRHFEHSLSIVTC
jgi:hypothetical protein